MINDSVSILGFDSSCSIRILSPNFCCWILFKSCIIGAKRSAAILLAMVEAFAGSILSFEANNEGRSFTKTFPTATSLIKAAISDASVSPKMFSMAREYTALAVLGDDRKLFRETGKSTKEVRNRA